MAESTKDFGDEYVAQLQQSNRQIKSSREMGEQYMVLEELLREEKDAGRAEGRVEERIASILEILSGMGIVPEETVAAVSAITSLDTLQILFQEALHADSMEQFAQILETYRK